MYQQVITSKPVEVDADDVISIADAAKMTSRTIQDVISLMNRGRLPVLTRHPADDALPGESPQRFTLKSVVMKLPEKGRGRATKRKSKNKAG